MTILRMRIKCWIPKATNSHSEYVMLITFPLQQWLKERASMLRYTYIACIVQTLQVPVVDFCENDTELSYYIQRREFLNHMINS